jgi:phytoene dehydrogenase-like protein
MKKYDAIIIGGGLGGLISGAKLSKEGKRVLLLEQHNIPGGCATTFKRKDFTMEVGLHEMDGLDETDPKTEKLKKACSLISIYIGFKSEIKNLGNKNYSTFIFDESVKSQKDMLKNHRGDFEKRNFVFVDYSQIDAGLTSKGKSFGAACSVDYLTDWENLSKEEYKAKKEEVAQIFFKRLEKEIPGISAEIEYYEVGTSKTIQRYTKSPGGSAYGFAQTPEKAGMFRVPNKSPIKNFYFASAWTNPGGGFTGAILSGWFCANEILKK